MSLSWRSLEKDSPGLRGAPSERNHGAHKQTQKSRKMYDGKFTSVLSSIAVLKVDMAMGYWTVFSSHWLVSGMMKIIESGKS